MGTHLRRRSLKASGSIESTSPGLAFAVVIGPGRFTLRLLGCCGRAMRLCPRVSAVADDPTPHPRFVQPGLA
eukprot:499276-Pleurochrysis_carterae.AAC.1